MFKKIIFLINWIDQKPDHVAFLMTLLSILGIFSGLASFLFIVQINNILTLLIEKTLKHVVMKETMFLFGLILLMIITKRIFSLVLIKYSQDFFWSLRIELTKLIFKSKFEFLNKNKNRIHSAIVSDIGILNSVFLKFIDFVISLVIVLGCIVYIGIISAKLLIIILSVLSIGLYIYKVGVQKASKLLLKNRECEDHFFKHFMSILGGFKEIKLNFLKGNDIMENEVGSISKESKNLFVDAQKTFINYGIFMNVVFYFLIGIIPMYLAPLLNIKGTDIVSLILVLFYLLGPISSLIGIVPFFNQASISINKIYKLQEDLCVNFEVNQETKNTEYRLDDFEKLEIKNLHFSYKEDNDFQVGPIDFVLKKGEVVFIHGGNGSGKTSFILLMLKLLNPSSETIFCINDKEIEEADLTLLIQSLFGTVFSDFYLFDKIYGNPNFDIEKFNQLLILFELDEKVTINGKQLSTVNLSTGQRKRLSLIIIILENRPILVLDEWAADQDPIFRKKFYREILPILKEEGKTILAITHDDSYYDCCDKLYKMESGKLRQQENLLLI